jgi:large repetitive protein
MDDNRVWSGVLTRAGRKLARAGATLLAALIVLALAGGGTALGAEPTIAIDQPHDGSFTHDQTPTFTGTTADTLDAVTLNVYEGSGVSGSPVQTLVDLAPVEISAGEGTWEATASSLVAGQYTAVAEQASGEEPAELSDPVTFTVDTTSPHVTVESLPSPSNDAAPTLEGAAGTEAGDDPSVEVEVFEGTKPEGTLVQSAVVGASGASWSHTLSKLADGTYTAKVTQEDQAGNRASTTVTFVVDTKAPAVTLNAPKAFTNNQTPNFIGGAGVASGDDPSVTVTIYEGSVAGGTIVQAQTVAVSGSSWSYTPSSKLAQGTYTVQASQEDKAGNVGKSAAAAFVVDTKAPAVTINQPASPTKNATPALSGAAGTLSGDDPAVAVAIHEGGVGGTVVQSGAALVSGASWSYAASKLPDGTYTVQASQEDKAGNVGKTAAVTLTVDTTAPSVSINTLASPTKISKPALGGGAGTAAEDQATVTVTIYQGVGVGATVAQSQAVSVSGSSWSYTASTLADGTYTAQATQEDKAGNVGASAEMTFTVDTKAPAVTLNAVSSPTKNNTPTLAGAAGTASGDIVSVAVTIYNGSVVGGTVAQTGTAVPSGSAWSYTATKLPDGIYTAQVTQEDKAGNVGTSAATTFTVDTVAPVVTITPPPVYTNDTTPTLSGVAGALSGDSESVTVKIFEGATAKGTIAESAVVARSGTSWSFTPGKELAQKTYTAQVTQEDKAGNVGTSAAVTFTVDTTAPAVTINQVGTFTKTATPTLSGADGALAGDNPSVAVTIYNGTGVSGTITQSGAAILNGSTWSYAATKLPDGTYTAQAAQTDQAGNSGKSAATTFTVDTAAPVVTITPPAAFTSDTTPSLDGTLGILTGDDASVTVTIFEGASASGKIASTGTAMVSGGAWTFTPSTALPQGTYTAQASQEDKAGNLGKSAGATFAVDTTAPAVSIDPVGTPTKNVTPTFTGPAGVASGDHPSVTVKIFSGESTQGKLEQSAGVVVSAGKWSYAATPALKDGTYTIQATQTDEAGNLGSAAVTFTVDTTAPAVSIHPPATPSKDQTPTLSGAAGVASGDVGQVAVSIYKGEVATGSPVQTTKATVSGGEWSYKATQLADGTYTAQATQTDQAGNVGTAEVIFTVDTTAPAVTVHTVTSPTNTATPILSGAAGTATGDHASVSVKIYAGSTATGTALQSASAPASAGEWSYTATHLEDGTYTAQATQTDETGNVGTSSAVTFTVDTTAPTVTISNPKEGVKISVASPTFSGLAGHASGDLAAITLNIYKGATATGAPIVVHVTPSGSNWTTSAVTELSDATYTAQAEQSDTAGNVGKSKTVTFTVKTELTLDESSGFVSREKTLVTGAAPSFSGGAGSGEGDSKTVTVRVIAESGETPDAPITVSRSGSRWTAGPFPKLPDGNYTVEAVQGAESVEATFKVDADAPQVTLTSPANASASFSTSEAVSGAAGTAPGDLPEVGVRLYSGASASGAPIRSVTVGASSTWSSVFEGLAPGTYTAQAEQRDDVGNVGTSAPVTFAVLAPAPAVVPTPPAASFRWVPATPHPGEPITLISTSTDPNSPITGYAWALAGDSVFSPGESTLTTSFATAGSHTVQLRVSDANGQSSVVAETISVSTAAPALMQPFPVVRIAGSFTSSGARINLLTVLAPVGATVTVTCHGGGCPKSQHLVAASGAKSKSGTVLITFRRFERKLRAGAVLDVWVSNHGQIGKFTRFLIRHNKTPTRTDMCLNSSGTKPIVCPSS